MSKLNLNTLIVFCVLILANTAWATLVTNGDWSTGDETGWTRWIAPWGSGQTWSVTSSGPTAPEGTLSLFGGQTGNFGWYQAISVQTAGQYTLAADWTGDVINSGWAEVMFFTCQSNLSSAEICIIIEEGLPSNIAFKKDGYGMNPPAAWSWQPADLSLQPGGNGGQTQVLNPADEMIIVALKLGSPVGETFLSCDNIVVTAPEPVTHYVNPGESIQAAINASSNGDKIEVAPGTYAEAINFNGKAVKLYSRDGPEVTTIDGTGHYHVVQCTSGEDANSILEGFTITGGNANGVSPNDRGGGMYNYQSSPTVTNCTFTGNSASGLAGAGGGIYCEYSSLSVTNCTFTGNSASGLIGIGGGMYCQTSSPTVTNCTFSGNSASQGGGMYNISDLMVTNCILWGNTPDEISGVSTIVSYSDVEGGWSGAGINNINADPCFVNAGGGDLRLLPQSPCIDAGHNDSVPADTADLDNDGNIVEPIPYDLDGHPRFVDGDCNDTPIVDMGAYEFNWLYLGDFAGGCDIVFADFAVFALAWLSDETPTGNWNPDCDISLPPDGIIDELDLKIFTDNWLVGAE